MANEAVFVAIGIACVVGVLLFIVFIIYCVKKQQDKEQTRQMRERRAREERHRRHLMRSHVVQPPPYDPNRQTITGIDPLPNSPPPAYKEVATPLPRNRDIAGLGGMNYAPPAYGRGNDADYVPTVSRNVAPANTVFTGNNYFIGHPSGTAVYSYNANYSNRNNNPNVYNNNMNNNQRYPANQNRVDVDNSVQVRPVSAAATSIIVASSPDGGSTQVPRSYDNRQAPPGARSVRRGPGNTAGFREHTNERASFDPVSVANSNERVSYNSTNRRETNNPAQGYTLPREARRRSYVIPTNQSEDLHHNNFASANQNGNRDSNQPVYYGINSGTLQTAGLGNVQLRNSYGQATNRRNSNQRLLIAHPTSGADDLSLI